MTQKPVTSESFVTYGSNDLNDSMGVGSYTEGGDGGGGIKLVPLDLIFIRDTPCLWTQ